MKSDIFSKYFNFSKVLVNIRGGGAGGIILGTKGCELG